MIQVRFDAVVFFFKFVFDVVGGVLSSCSVDDDVVDDDHQLLLLLAALRECQENPNNLWAE